MAASGTFRVVTTSSGHEENEEGVQTAARTKTFMSWVNLHLQAKGIRIRNLHSDFEDGVVLIRLMECLAPGKKMPGRYGAPK